jgi:hypothetical protein
MSLATDIQYLLSFIGCTDLAISLVHNSAQCNAQLPTM